MEQFNLDEYLANPSMEVVTRDGRAVKIHCTNYKSIQPIIAEIEGNNCSHSFNKDGKYYLNYKQNSPNDLFFAPEKKEGWVNIYRNKTNGESYCGKIYESEDDAKSQTDILTTIKIEWEE